MEFSISVPNLQEPSLHTNPTFNRSQGYHGNHEDEYDDDEIQSSLFVRPLTLAVFIQLCLFQSTSNEFKILSTLAKSDGSTAPFYVPAVDFTSALMCFHCNN